MEKILVLSIAISFIVTFIFLPAWIKKARKIGLIWPDMNKYEREGVAGSGGIIVILAFLLSILVYIALKTFYFKSAEHIIEILALTTSVLMFAGIGIIDDLLGWQHGGLSKNLRILLCVFSAIPLVVINAGHSSMNLPIMGLVNFGLLYPLLLVPLGIVATSTTFNMLAGFNGLEAGQGVILLTSLSFVSYFSGNSWVALIGLYMAAALVAFWFLNKVPAKILPGDVLTYPVGGLIGIMAILGNFEKIAVFFFIPYILETILKLRGKLKKQSFGKPLKDGTLDLNYDKLYGLTHVAIWLLNKVNIKPTEKKVVYLIWLFQIAIILIGFIIFKKGIFM